MLDFVKDKLNHIDKKYLVLGGVGLSLLAVAGYFLLKNNKTPRNKKDKSEKKELRVRKSEGDNSKEPQSEEKTLIRIVNLLKKTIPQNKALDFQGVKAIYKAHFQLSRKEFRELTLLNRTERRTVLDNFVQYNKILSEGVAKLDAIHNKHLNAILAQLKIEETEWVQLTEEAANQFPDEWDDLILQNDNEELDSIRQQAKPKLKLKMLIEIEKFRIARLKQKIDQFKSTFSDLDPTDLYDLLEKWGRDVVYQQFKVQEEDIQYSSNQLTEEEKESLEGYHDELTRLMESIVLNGSEQDEDC